MSLLSKGAVVPEKIDDLLKFLDDMADFINKLCSDRGIPGRLNFSVFEPEARENWRVEVKGQIPAGQNFAGKEIWKPVELQDCYSGKTLKEAAEQIFSAIKLHYGDKLPS